MNYRLSVSINPTPTDDDVVVIEDSSLSWRDGGLRLVEFELSGSVVDCTYAAGRRTMAMANLHRGGEPCGGRVVCDPIDA